MPQVFRPRANALAWTVLIIAAALLVVAVCLAAHYFSSPYYSGVDRTPPQPVPFSHKHHVGELGLDCRYCHTSVEDSSFAGVPESEVCMTCHSQLWTNAGLLAPVRDSLKNDRPLRWQRVHDLPDYVHFDHSAHVNHGVPCQACHGRVDEMPLTTQKKTLFMQFCLDCHRNPAPHLRPPDAVFEIGWQPAGVPSEARQRYGERLMARYHTPTTERLTDCSLCHQ
ncbi:cytochrome C [Alcanivorax sp. N3-2A]|nr:cytochrome C [Alcanivorax sp. N3-2A]|tara:strand:- start:95789 stop:96460 length:672 start_codon:yes stop_codon:yes gene_type:complete